jgi:hypothetical protein
MTHLGQATGALLRRRFHACVSKMMIAYLESFLGASPFRVRQTQDPRVDARLDVLYKEAMKKLDEVDDDACMQYAASKMRAWYTKFPPRATWQPRLPNSEAGTPPQRNPEYPAANGPRPKRCMALSDDESAAAK